MAETIHLVEDDPDMREAIEGLLRPVGYHVESYRDAAAFFDTAGCPDSGCLILDVRLPGASGLQVQKLLADAGSDLAIIFITGHPDVEVAVRAMKAGAVDFLRKPLNEQELLDAVHDALATSSARQTAHGQVASVEQAYRALSPSEREVMGYVTAGLLNKQIAARTGRSENTVKVHRGRIMRKMKVRSLADLVRLADTIGVAPDKADGGK